MSQRFVPALRSRSPTLEITACCLLVFLVQTLVGVAVGGTAAYGLFALSRPFVVAPWTLVTSVYAHAGIGHLLGNLLLLLLVGLPLERLTTRRRFHLFFLVSGAAAGVFQLLMTASLGAVPLIDGGPPSAVLGASGAIFALLGYLLTSNRLSTALFERLALPPRVQLLLFGLVALVVAFGTANAPNVAIWGHCFGFFSGLLAGRGTLLRAATT